MDSQNGPGYQNPTEGFNRQSGATANEGGALPGNGASGGAVTNTNTMPGSAATSGVAVDPSASFNQGAVTNPDSGNNNMTSMPSGNNPVGVMPGSATGGFGGNPRGMYPNATDGMQSGVPAWSGYPGQAGGNYQAPDLAGAGSGAYMPSAAGNVPGGDANTSAMVGSGAVGAPGHDLNNRVSSSDNNNSRDYRQDDYHGRSDSKDERDVGGYRGGQGGSYRRSRSRERHGGRSDYHNSSRDGHYYGGDRGPRRRSRSPRGYNDGDSGSYRRRSSPDSRRVRDDDSGTKLFVGNLAYETTDDNLRSHMEVAGDIKDIHIFKDRSYRSKGCGVVQFYNPDDAKRAIELLRESSLDGRRLLIRYNMKDPRKDYDGSGGHGGYNKYGGGRSSGYSRSYDQGPGNPTKQVFVGNLPYSVTDEQLYDSFKNFGKIESAMIKKNERGLSKGHGIVKFSSIEEAQSAIDRMNGAKFNERMVNVKFDQFV